MKYLSSLAMVFAMLFTMPTWACTVTGSALSAAAIKAIEADCAKAEEALTAQAAKIDTERLSAYAEVATQIAKAVGIAAKEMGVAVNDFIQTPAGILTVAVILVKVLGKLVAAIAFTFMVMYCCYRTVRYIWSRYSDEYIEVPRWFGFGKKTVRKVSYMSYSEARDSQIAWTFLVAAVGLVSVIPVFIVL